jgi:hypothetical protein
MIASVSSKILIFLQSMHGQYMCFVFVLKAWFLAASTNLWTSGMYDGSSFDKLYIQKDRSIMSCAKISKLIDLNAKQVV